MVTAHKVGLELGPGHAMDHGRQDPGARSQEPGARRQETGARRQEPGARSQDGKKTSIRRCSLQERFQIPQA